MSSLTSDCSMADVLPRGHALAHIQGLYRAQQMLTIYEHGFDVHAT